MYYLKKVTSVDDSCPPSVPYKYALVNLGALFNLFSCLFVCFGATLKHMEIRSESHCLIYLSLLLSYFPGIILVSRDSAVNKRHKLSALIK